MPQDPFNRETLIALRARRKAYRLARDLLHPSLDPHRCFCRHCGHALDFEMLDSNDHIRCSWCGLRTRLPPGMAVDLRRYLANRIAPHRTSPPPPTELADAALWVYFAIGIAVCVVAAL